MSRFVYKNSIENLSKIIKEINAQKPLIFTGKKSFEQIKPVIEKQLRGLNNTFYNDFSVNPKMNEVELSIEKLGNNFDVFIAIGGGSVIDFAKLYKFKTDKTKKLIVIPTTAGTGAEATRFAVTYIDGVKKSIEEESILPDFAIVDSTFAEKTPKDIKISCALDAFCQAIESFWSVNSTMESTNYAKESLELCRDNLVDYINNPNSINTEKMMKASYLAGCAINISKTTAAHAFSYKLTSSFGIPHGKAVALSIANLMEYNSLINEENCQDIRGVYFVKARIEEIKKILNIKIIKQYFKDIFTKIDFEYQIYKLSKDEIKLITASVDTNRLKNNPKILSEEEILNIFNID